MADIHFSMPSIHIPQEMFELSAFFIALKYAFTMSVISVIQTNLTNDMMNMISQHPTNKDRDCGTRVIKYYRWFIRRIWFKRFSWTIEI